MNRAMMSLPGLALLFLNLGVVFGCSETTEPQDDPTNGPDSGAVVLAAQVVASGLIAPTHLTAPAGDARLFVAEQAGRIRVVEAGQLLATPFLDITDRVVSGGERGLLGVAFHPLYDSNGYLYVSYTGDGGSSRIERYSVTANPNVADPASAKLILTVAQPFSNHNGGLIAFGPDGKLYVGLGDGGNGGDPQGHGQNMNTLLGSLLRIDVDAGDPYAVPADNPFVGTAGADEIWAYGLRNPWRFSFDYQAGDLYVADVGQDRWEEVNVVAATAAGLNYGWNVMEGAHCFGTASCDDRGLVLPVLEYDHSQGCSITGGYVYRGAAVPEIQGHYFYSDYCRGFLRSFRYSDGTVTDARQWDVGNLGNVLSFGEDGVGELYVLSSNGNVYRLISAD